MSQYPGIVHTEGAPSTIPLFSLPQAHLPAPLAYGSPHYPPQHPQQAHHPPPSPRSSHTYPAGDYANNSFNPTSSPPLGTGGSGVGGVSRGPSFSSRSGRGTIPYPSAPGYSLEEHKAFREIGDYMSRDGDCMLVRRFGTLRFRDMLCKQAQVEEVERRLVDADREELAGGGNVETMKELMKEMDVKLKAYDDALDRCRRTYTMPRPSKRSLSDVEVWLDTRGFQRYLPDELQDVITIDQQLITNGVVTRFAALIASRVFKKETTRKAGVHQIPYHRAVLVSRALISFIAPVILLVPVVLLCYQKRLWVQIVVVAVATITSSIVMMVAKAGGAEVFMATSAYAAVMVVFLGAVANVGNGPGKGS